MMIQTSPKRFGKAGTPSMALFRWVEPPWDSVALHVAAHPVAVIQVLMCIWKEQVELAFLFTVGKLSAAVRLLFIVSIIRHPAMHKGPHRRRRYSDAQDVEYASRAHWDRYMGDRCL
jgi:hypothetical protein